MNSTGLTVKIEHAGPEHLPDIAALAAIVWRAHYPGIITHAQIDYMLARMYDLDVLRREIAEGITFLRACMDGELTGFAAFGLHSACAEYKLHKLYVAPQWQRLGIGGALLQSAETLARGSGARTMVLNVNKGNEPAIAAYRRHGFLERESVIVDIGNGFLMDDYIMAKSL